MSKPIIQIGDVVREMTDEEYALYLESEEKRVAEEQARIESEPLGGA